MRTAGTAVQARKAMSPVVLVFGRRQRRDARQTELAGVQKAPMHEVAGSMAPDSAASAMGIVCWWPISMVDAAPARGDVHARMQVSPGA